MNIPESKRPIFDKIISGETPVLMCCEWGKQATNCVRRKCVLCDTELGLSENSQAKEKEMGMVTLCTACVDALSHIAPLDVNAIYNGKLMSFTEGLRQAAAFFRRRN